jgi:hypothetical protein
VATGVVIAVVVAMVVVAVPVVVVVVTVLVVEEIVTTVVEGITGNGGTIVAVQVVASELKPEPVNVNTVLMLPDVGVTITSAVTLNAAYEVKSPVGDPITLRVQLMLVVAYGLTTKVP